MMAQPSRVTHRKVGLATLNTRRRRYLYTKPIMPMETATQIIEMTSSTILETRKNIETSSQYILIGLVKLLTIV